MEQKRLDELLKKDKTELIRMLLEKEELQIPIGIFSHDMAPLEALVRYLKEKKDLSIIEISLRLNRQKQTIWTTYYNAKKQKISFSEEGRHVPLSIFSKQKASALESLAFYLKDILGMTYTEIASILKKDIRTVWTCHKRFEKKVMVKKENWRK
jgi:hypothetical protein